MCDYCGCRSMPVIEDLGAEHEELLFLAEKVRRGIEAGDAATARARFAELLDRLRVHDDAEEAGLFAALRQAGELDAEVAALLTDHAATWQAAEGLDAETWAAGVRGILDDLRDHIAREEYDVFPAAVMAVAPSAWADMAAAADQARAHAR